jgi:hypothetical protein
MILPVGGPTGTAIGTNVGGYWLRNNQTFETVSAKTARYKHLFECVERKLAPMIEYWLENVGIRMYVRNRGSTGGAEGRFQKILANFASGFSRPRAGCENPVPPATIYKE